MCTESSYCIRKGGFPSCFWHTWCICSLCAGGLHTQKEPWWPAGEWPGVRSWPPSPAWLLASFQWLFVCCPHERHRWACFVQGPPFRALGATPERWAAGRNWKTAHTLRIWPPGVTDWGVGGNDMRCGVQLAEKTGLSVAFGLAPPFSPQKPLPFSSWFILLFSHLPSLPLFQSLSP